MIIVCIAVCYSERNIFIIIAHAFVALALMILLYTHQILSIKLKEIEEIAYQYPIISFFITAFFSIGFGVLFGEDLISQWA